MPPSLEERVAYLEGKVEEHSRGFDEIRTSIGRLDGHVLAVDRKIDRFREELSSRIDGLGARIDGLDLKVDRFRDELDRKVSRQFTWIVGIQVTVLIAVLGSLIQG